MNGLPILWMYMQDARFFFKKPGVPKVFGLDLLGYSAPYEPVFALCFYNDKPSCITELDLYQDTVLRCDN